MKILQGSTYFCLAFLRVALVFWPQNGYIHPDEYFQSVEIFSGHFFDLEIDKPWEFLTTFPIRSMGLNYIIFGLGYKLLKICNLIAHYFKWSIITPYTLVVFPRLIFCLLTFSIDYTLYKLCLNNNEKYKSKIIILASSYVIVIYGSHTFSNVTEMILLSLLLYYVSESMTFSNTIVKQREYLNKRYQESKTTVEKAKIHKLRLFIATDSLRNCFTIATITVTGFFNRPTFLIFAICPVFFWLYRGIGYKSVILMQFHYRMICLLMCALPSLIFFIISDSFYYGYLSVAEIEFMKIDINNFVFTPLNFLKYNMNPDNLALHGSHPKWLHILINLPILFNLLVIFNLVFWIKLCIRFVKRQWHYMPTIRSIKGLMTSTFITSLCILSLFSHQEPRFLLPLIIPLVYLHAESILPERVMALEHLSEEKIVKAADNRKSSNNLFSLWLIINAIFALFYGFIHQGGMYPAVVDLSKEVQIKRHANFYIVTSHLYSIPRCLFLERSTDMLYSMKHTKYKLVSRVQLFQEGSKDLTQVINKLVILSNVTGHNTLLYYLFPNSKKRELELLAHNKNISYVACQQYFPHISTEAFPDLFKFFMGYKETFFSIPNKDMLCHLKELFSLALCKITVN